MSKAVADAASRVYQKLHDFPDKTQRVPTRVWKYMLLSRKDTIVINGWTNNIEAKNLGAGVYELSVR